MQSDAEHTGQGREKIVSVLGVRDVISLALMLLPLVTVLVFFVVNPSAWISPLATFFQGGDTVIRRDPGWAMCSLALLGASVSALMGMVGLQEKWQYNRRFQRILAGSLGAALTTLLLTTWQLTSAIEVGETPEVGLAMFAFMLSMLYGVICLVVTPPDRQHQESEWNDSAAI